MTEPGYVEVRLYENAKPDITIHADSLEEQVRLEAVLATFKKKKRSKCNASAMHNVCETHEEEESIKVLSTEVLNYLNETASKCYQPIDANLKFVRARLTDYTVADLKKVIDRKVKEWLGTGQEKYLRPETLFNATKFQGYINEPDITTTPQGDPTGMAGYVERLNQQRARAK